MANPSRVAFTLFGKEIYWYGVLMALGIVLAVLLAQGEEKRKKLPKDIVVDMCLAIIPAGIVGARLYYVLLEFAHYKQNPISILYIWEGGLAIYGAIIGGLLAAFIFARIRKVRFLALADTIVPGLVLAQAIGRWGNFFNQEAYGLPITQEMLAKFPILNYFPFSVSIDGMHYFDNALCTACVTAANGGNMHLATFFYESLWCLLIFVVIMLVRRRFRHDGDALVWYALLYSFERMFVEGLRGDSLWLIQPSAPGLADGVRASQLLSAVLFVLSAGFLIVRAIREKKLNRLIWPSPLEAAEEPAARAPEEHCSCEHCDACAGEEAETTEPEAADTHREDDGDVEDEEEKND